MANKSGWHSRYNRERRQIKRLVDVYAEAYLNASMAGSEATEEDRVIVRTEAEATMKEVLDELYRRAGLQRRGT